MNISGNWEFTPAATTGSLPFTVLSGYIQESPGTPPGTHDFTTAALQATSTSCYSGSPNVFLEGEVNGLVFGAGSFSSQGQVLGVNTTADATGTHEAGTYTVTGGCGNGQKGTLAGTLYAPLNGTYSSSAAGSPASTFRFLLTQAAQGVGDGRSLVTGSATFTGIQCFSSGTLAGARGSVLGSSVSLVFDTNETGGSQVVAVGSFNAAASSIALSSIKIVGGSCAAALPGVTLTLAK